MLKKTLEQLPLVADLFADFLDLIQGFTPKIH